MPTLDAAHHEIEFRILVVGGASEFFLSTLPLRDGKLELHEIQGWKPTLTFHAFSTDPWAGDGVEGARLEQVLPHVDGLVLTDALQTGQHYSSTAMERLARGLGPAMIRTPATVFGCRALEEEWATLSGAAPVQMVDPAAEHAMTLIKALCGVLLRSKMRSIPPPPPPPPRPPA